MGCEQQMVMGMLTRVAAMQKSERHADSAAAQSGTTFPGARETGLL